MFFSVGYLHSSNFEIKLQSSVEFGEWSVEFYIVIKKTNLFSRKQ